MKKDNWLIKAMILGAVFFLAAFIVKPVGVSTQFSVLSGMLHSTVDPEVITEDPDSPNGYRSSNAYYDKGEGKIAKSIKNPINYDFVFVLAIPIGAYLAHAFVNLKTKGKVKDGEQKDTYCGLESEITGNNNVKRVWSYVLPFIGGFLLLYGARMADGCTSGHMMSGMMQESVSGYLFAAAVFAVAIPTAIIIGNRANNRAKGGK